MIYFDNAATTFPKPPSVVRRVHQAVCVYGGNPGRSGHPVSMATSRQVFAARETAARFFHVPTENIVFTSNCTHSLNMAIQGIMAQGGHMIISQLEHNSVYRPVYAMAQRGEITFDIAPIGDGSPDTIVENFRSLIRRDTKAIVCTHASNVIGKVMPITQLGNLCREHGITFIVDAAQSAGVLPIDLQQQNIDILCTAGHKGLYGITGTGIMALAPGVSIRPLMQGGTGSLSSDPQQPDFLPDRYESGTVNTVGILSIDAGIRHLQKIGLEKVYHHEFCLCEEIYSQLRKWPDVITYVDDFSLGSYVPIVLFNIRGKESSQVAEQLGQQGICLRGGLHCSPLAHQMLNTEQIGAVRLSPSIFSTTRDVCGFLSALRKLL